MNPTGETEARIDVVRTAQRLQQLGLSVATSGNVSRRWAGGMLITPSAVAYDALGPEDVVHVLEDGSVRDAERRPSSESPFHLAIYRARPDRHAVVHSHSPHATMLACTRRAIPAFHYMVAMAGGRDIPCVAYADFGTEELATRVAGGLADRDACLMAHHGQVAIGPSLASALDLAWVVEDLASVYHGALQLGEVPLLDEEQITRMVERMRHYRTPG